MLRFACPSCHAVILAPDEMAKRKARCSQCKQLFRVPSAEAAKVTVDSDNTAQTNSTDGSPKARNVNYLHHTRDNDGDIIIYFSDIQSSGGGGRCEIVAC